MNVCNDLKKRFLDKVNKTSSCWIWIGADDGRKGYGRINVNGKTAKAHRISYELFNGEIKDNLNVLHKCDNPKCVNPDHLFLGTQKMNMADMYSKNRAVHHLGESHHNGKKVLCIRGHEYSEDNTRIYIKKSGSSYRYCKKCESERTARRRASRQQISKLT